MYTFIREYGVQTVRGHSDQKLPRLGLPSCSGPSFRSMLPPRLSAFFFFLVRREFGTFPFRIANPFRRRVQNNFQSVYFVLGMGVYLKVCARTRERVSVDLPAGPEMLCKIFGPRRNKSHRSKRQRDMVLRLTDILQRFSFISLDHS